MRAAGPPRILVMASTASVAVTQELAQAPIVGASFVGLSGPVSSASLVMAGEPWEEVHELLHGGTGVSGAVGHDAVRPCPATRNTKWRRLARSQLSVRRTLSVTRTGPETRS